MNALTALYRRVVSDVANVLTRPTEARQELGMERAMAFIREHLSDPLSLPQVARVAGFAPGYFSKLFRREHGIAFERHVRRLRIERAKQMLQETTLGVDRVRRLSGFHTKSLFFRAFHEATQMTPLEFRAGLLPSSAS